MEFEVRKQRAERQESNDEDRRRPSRRWWIVGSLIAVAVLGGWRTISSWGPSEQALELGREIFVHEWTENDPMAGDGDGLGPVFNARSCVACHFQGGVGGGGTNEFNVVAFEVLPNGGRSERLGGVIHSAATQPAFEQSFRDLRKKYPVESRIVEICNAPVTRRTDPLFTETVNTPPLFGLGLIDELSSWSIRKHAIERNLGQVGKEFQLDFDSAPAGRIRKVDGAFGKFGWKGQFATLEDFVATACAVELGLSNSHRRQDDPDGYGENAEASIDIDRRQLNALVSFVRNLPRPERILPTEPTELAEVERGEQFFSEIGCADCHTPNLGGVEGLYSDLMLHSLVDPERRGYGSDAPELPDDGSPSRDEWKTPPLWGVADSAPYMHDGSSATLAGAISQHRGNANGSRKAYNALSPDHREALLAFLGTLRAPRSALPIPSRDELVAR